MNLAAAAFGRARQLLAMLRALPGDVAALRLLPPILPPGVIEIRTPPDGPGEGALLRTRVLLLGDVICVVAQPLLALPQAERTRLLDTHRDAVRQAIERLGQAQLAAVRLVGCAWLGAGSATGAAGAGAVLAEQGLDAALAASGVAALGIGSGAAFAVMLAGRAGRWYARQRLRKAQLPEINAGTRSIERAVLQAP